MLGRSPAPPLRRAQRCYACRVKALWLLLPIAASGACGGSTSGTTQQDPNLLIEQLCDKIASAQCSPMTAQECNDQVHAQRAEEAKSGCTAAFDQVVTCGIEKLSGCEHDIDELCKPEIDALDQCSHPGGGDECSMGQGGMSSGDPPFKQSCAISCPTWGVNCATADSPTVVCTCTGPKAGTTFTPSSCLELSAALGAEYCSG